MNIVKRCVMNCSPREGKPPCEDCEDHDTDLIQVWLDKSTHCVMPIPTSSGEHISHTLAGFKGAFVVENGTRPPTEQEIWNAGVRSGMERAKQESGWRDMDSAPKDGSQIMLYCENSTIKITGGYWYAHDGVWIAGGYMQRTPPKFWQPLPLAPKE